MAEGTRKRVEWSGRISGIRSTTSSACASAVLRRAARAAKRAEDGEEDRADAAGALRREGEGGDVLRRERRRRQRRRGAERRQRHPDDGGRRASRVPTYAKLPAQSTADAACAEEVVVAGCSAAAGRPSAGWPSGRDVATRSAEVDGERSGGSLFAASR